MKFGQLIDTRPEIYVLVYVQIEDYQNMLKLRC